MQKQVLAINDISCVGRCSLTVALPVLSAMGIETNVLPTAVLSTHTGGFTDFTFRDLTTDLLPIVEHWQSLQVKFAGIYSGYLGSLEQVGLVEQIINKVKNPETLIFVDPVMADQGKLYQNFNQEYVEKMKGLCKRANVLVPNMTEAALLLNRPYEDGPHDKTQIEAILKELAAFGADIVCLTGVFFTEKEIGAAFYERATGNIEYVFNKKITGDYHGTGDLFASILFGGIMRELPLLDAVQLAVDYTMKSIEATYKAQTDVRFGVQFEPFLWELGQKVAAQ